MRGGLISYIFVTVMDDSWQLEPMYVCMYVCMYINNIFIVYDKG